MTPAERAVLREKCERATPGPLDLVQHDSDYCAAVKEDLGLSTYLAWRCGREDDAAFIAAARTAVPALLDALEEAERKLAQARSLLREHEFFSGETDEGATPPTCPECGARANFRWERPGDVTSALLHDPHAPGCSLAEALEADKGAP